MYKDKYTFLIVKISTMFEMTYRSEYWPWKWTFTPVEKELLWCMKCKSNICSKTAISTGEILLSSLCPISRSSSCISNIKGFCNINLLTSIIIGAEFKPHSSDWLPKLIITFCNKALEKRDINQKIFMLSTIFMGNESTEEKLVQTVIKHQSRGKFHLAGGNVPKWKLPIKQNKFLTIENVCTDRFSLRAFSPVTC